MTDDKKITKNDLPDAAKRALAEAAERRAAQVSKEEALDAKRETEQGGPKGHEPTRFGDWERNGRAVDF